MTLVIMSCLVFLDEFKHCLNVHYSPSGTLERTMEENTFMCLIDFVDKCEGKQYYNLSI